MNCYLNQRVISPIRICTTRFKIVMRNFVMSTAEVLLTTVIVWISPMDLSIWELISPSKSSLRYLSHHHVSNRIIFSMKTWASKRRKSSSTISLPSASGREDNAARKSPLPQARIDITNAWAKSTTRPGSGYMLACLMNAMEIHNSMQNSYTG